MKGILIPLAAAFAVYKLSSEKKPAFKSVVKDGRATITLGKDKYAYNLATGFERDFQGLTTYMVYLNQPEGTVFIIKDPGEDLNFVSPAALLDVKTGKLLKVYTDKEFAAILGGYTEQLKKEAKK